MAETFAGYVRSGRLQKNFDDAVEKAAEEAKKLGLRRSAHELEGGTDATKSAASAEKPGAPRKPAER